MDINEHVRAFNITLMTQIQSTEQRFSFIAVLLLHFTVTYCL